MTSPAATSTTQKPYVKLLTEQVRERTNRPDAVSFSWEDLTDEGFAGVKVGICDPPPLLKSGPNKGRPNWKMAQNRQFVHVLYAERDAWAAAWAERTGNCVKCTGPGQAWVGWSQANGHRYETCKACGGTGAHQA